MGVEMGTGPRPVKAPRGNMSEGAREMMEAAGKLQPGGWLRWKDAPKSALAIVRKLAKNNGLAVEAYKEVGGPAGSVIVAHVEAQAGASQVGAPVAPGRALAPEVRAAPASVRAADSPVGAGAAAAGGEVAELQLRILKTLHRAGRRMSLEELSRELGRKNTPQAAVTQLVQAGCIVTSHDGPRLYLRLTSTGTAVAEKK
jgi:hypothetical protein